MDGAPNLRDLPVRHDTLVCVDSDGTVFDTMPPKQRLGFQGAFLDVLGLRDAEAPVREMLEFAGLFSRTRGINRFALFLRALELLNRRPDFAHARGRLPDLGALAAWVRGPGPLSASRLEREARAQPDDGLRLALAWSAEVDRRIQREVGRVFPFAGVREALADMAAGSDLVIVSATQQTPLDHDWDSNGMRHIPLAIAGAAAGTKEVQIANLLSAGRDPGRVLLAGDSPGDLTAARATGIRFFPVMPGNEPGSWAELREQAYPAFRAGTYTPAAEERRIEAFLLALPESPPWER